jgi:hypothetical protein
VCCERGLFVCVCVRVRERESEREREREMGRKWERYFDLCKFHQFEKWFPAANMWDSLSKIRCVKLKTRWRVLKEKKRKVILKNFDDYQKRQFRWESFDNFPKISFIWKCHLTFRKLDFSFCTFLKLNWN